MHAILWVMKEIGGCDVPSLDTIQRVQAKLHKQNSVPTTQFKSAQGNLFYVNNVAKQIAEVIDYFIYLYHRILTMCTIMFRTGQIHLFNHMCLYPEETPNHMSETWHGEKLCKEIQLDELSLMVGVENKHFYINEIAKCHNGSYVYPVWWIY
ncbi:hypothetical protein M422DRAFT_47201 [Sphaerobolus stellatus SS14]|uniref:Uncharacterized protein n=1 Tax=Sphaerobolus stellatus (strain SS14) TaxID=990650 RepID=A0A0C9VR50_SPHS4|nr:hypothetical protein M422DRAFT_47201 [Sphaerobolus stellatus SS14]